MPYLLNGQLALGILFTAMIAEMIFSGKKALGFYDLRDTLANLVMYAGYVVIISLFQAGTWPGFIWLHSKALFTLNDIGQGPIAWWLWPTLFLIDDFFYYVFHLMSHRIRVFWAAHISHHSSRQFNISVGIRVTWLPFYVSLFWLPMLMIGFGPRMILVVQFLNFMYQALLHTKFVKSLGPLEKILNTPAHHRVHHARQANYIDKNFGGIFIIWDRLFGTFERENESAVYTSDTLPSHHNPLQITFQEYSLIYRDVKIHGPLRTLVSLLKPPGWIQRSSN